MLIDVFEDEINVQGMVEHVEDVDDVVVHELFYHFLHHWFDQGYYDANEICET